MNRIIISDDEKNIILEIENRDIKGCSFYNDGRIEKVTYDEIDVLKGFLLSNNNTKLPNEGEYSVVLDNETGFKHYFYDNREDYIMFFQNNGEASIETKEEYIGKHARREENIKNEKRFNIRNRIVTFSLVGLLFTMSIFSLPTLILQSRYPEFIRTNNFISVIDLFIDGKDLTPDDLIEGIHSSEDLSDEDQFFLAKRDLFQDILPYVNSSSFAKKIYRNRFKNITIKTYDNTGMRSAGYYSTGDPNSLYIADQYLDSNSFNDIISHEFIHMGQIYCRYNVISEACAEIVSSEYYEDSPAVSYSEEVYLMKKLMEIIGTEPILRYTYTSDFSHIKNAIDPYLTDNEYQIFLSDIERPNIDSPNYDEEEVKAKHESLNYLLDKIYERKFNKPSEKDMAISHLKDPSLVRYYFNQRKIAEVGSYYLAPLSTKKAMTLEDALINRIVYLYQTDETGRTIPVSYFDYLYSTYDTSKQIQYGSLITDPIDITLGEDNKLYVSIIEFNQHVKSIIPNVDEKIAEEENHKKL